MFYRSLLIAFLSLASGLARAHPSLELTEALRLAQAYVSEQRIANDQRYLESIAWHEDRADPTKSCWVVVWAPKGLAFDAQLVVWVFKDGDIKHQNGAW